VLSGADALTPGERRVAEMTADGMTNREIAEALFVTIKAVQWHLRHVYRKLGAADRSQIAAKLYEEAGREPEPEAGAG
jgi:DNA-binding CsgD family transcriptional regulator